MPPKVSNFLGAVQWDAFVFRGSVSYLTQQFYAMFTVKNNIWGNSDGAK
jgi:hypothetical protein